MSTANTDERNLALKEAGGLINEDVMQQIYDLMPEDKPFTDAIGSRSDKNHYVEWVNEALEAANPDNARIDGSDSTDNDTVLGNRYGNYHQIASKIVRVSDRGRSSDTIGASDELIRQLMKRQKALRRDVEASLTSNNVADPGANTTGDATGASTTAGIGSWIMTNNVGPGDFVAPTLSGTTGGYPDTAATAGTAAAGSEANIKAAMQLAFLEGGNPTLCMSTPAAITLLSTYMFTSSARIATFQSSVPQGNRTTASSGNGNSGGGVVAQGSVNMFVTDYGTLELVPNRFQPEVSTGVSDMYLIDTDYWEVGYLQGYETKSLARTGLAENREITVDFALCAMNERASAALRSIDTTTPWVA